MEEVPMPTDSEAATFWPFLLLVAALAVGYWFWSSSTSATSAAAPLPNAEELRKKRLEALSKAAPAPPSPAAVDGVPAPSAEERKRLEALSKPSPAAVDALFRQPVVVNGVPVQAKEEGLRLRRVEAETKTETKVPSPPASQVPAEAQQKIEKDVKDVEAKDLSVPSTDAVPQDAAVRKDAAVPKDDTSKPVSASLSLRARATLQGKSQVRNVEVPVEANVEQLQAEILKAFPEAAESKVSSFRWPKLQLWVLP